MENKLLENEEIVNESAETVEEVSTEESSVEAMEEIAEESTTEEACAEPEIEVAPVEDLPTEPVQEEVYTPSKRDDIKADYADAEDKLSFFKTAKWKKIWDKITTALLIGIMALPLLILIYILSYFLMR